MMEITKMSKICPWLTDAEFEEKFQSLQQRLLQHSRSTGTPIQTYKEGQPILLYPDGREEPIRVKEPA
jgi:hypothetical protein